MEFVETIIKVFSIKLTSYIQDRKENVDCLIIEYNLVFKKH